MMTLGDVDERRHHAGAIERIDAELLNLFPNWEADQRGMIAEVVFHAGIGAVRCANCNYERLLPHVRVHHDRYVASGLEGETP
jgi:hypothetical protein